jgi:hypothetical protein
MATTETAEEYWDRVGHKSRCERWGDEDGTWDCTCGTPPSPSTKVPGLDLKMLAYDLTEVLSNEHRIDVASQDVLRALPAFLTALGVEG